MTIVGRPVSLDATLEIVDPEERLAAITAWLDRAQEMAERARAARLQAVRELRNRPKPLPWPRIVALAEVGESYLRGKLQ